MTCFFKTIIILMIAVFALSACRKAPNSNTALESSAADSAAPNSTNKIPSTLSEILDSNYTETNSPLKNIDFKNFSYPLPRGWQDSDGTAITLENGVRKVTEERIGMRYLTTKYFDVTKDKQDDALVILRIDTGGSALPLVVYIFEWKNQKPDLVWYFRTGDRADGGLKRVFPNGENLGIELFGRDRYIFNQMETSKIIGDDEQLCCPTHFTRTSYDYAGDTFKLQGDRLTYLVADPNAQPEINMNEKSLEEEREK